MDMLRQDQIAEADLTDWRKLGQGALDAAGGVVVDDCEAPSCTVIADPDSNRACVCTTLSRAA